MTHRLIDAETGGCRTIIVRDETNARERPDR
jgi:hypothetical protein